MSNWIYWTPRASMWQQTHETTYTTLNRLFSTLLQVDIASAVPPPISQSIPLPWEFFPAVHGACFKAIGYRVRSIIIWTCNCRWMLNNSWVHKVNSWIAILICDSTEDRSVLHRDMNNWSFRLQIDDNSVYVKQVSTRKKIFFFWTLPWGFMSISMIMVCENFLYDDVPISTVVSSEFACRRLSNLRV